MAWRGVVEEYREFLPVDDGIPVVTILEGNTPLVPAPSLSRRTGARVYLKLEGCNPTGSFKDRGMAMAMTRARARGARTVICASTGNTSASAAAYAARAGLECYVILPGGKVALGKLAQALMYGARVLALEGNFDDALRLVREVTARHPDIEVVNSINPYRIEGQKTSAFEICDQLGAAPDYLCIPVGNAGNITAYWKGFVEYRQAGKVNSSPKMTGFQAEGAAPIVRGETVANPETLATAIRIGNPASWQGALRAIEESGGSIHAVTDEEIVAAYQILAREEGIFVEPASAAAVAGLLKLAGQGRFRPDSTVVCIMTGNGLKDPELAIKSSPPPVSVAANLEAVERVMGR